MGKLQFFGFASQFGVAVGTILEVGSELGGLFIAVDNVEVSSVDEHDVLEAEDFRCACKARMELFVDSSIVARVCRCRVQQRFGVVGVGVRSDVVVLQIAFRRRFGEILLDDGLAVDDFCQLREEHLRVKLLKLCGFIGVDGCLFELIVGFGEGLHALEHDPAIGHRDDLVSERFELGAQSGRFGDLDPSELVLDRFFDRRFPGGVSDPSHNGQGAKGDEQEQQDHFRLDTQSMESKHGSLLLAF